MKRKINLTEADLHKIVRKSLNEFFFFQGQGDSKARELGLEELEEFYWAICKANNMLSSLIVNPKYKKVKKQLTDMSMKLEEGGDIFMEVERILGISEY